MNTVLLTPLLTGGFALAGGLGGVILSNNFTSRAARQQRAEEDARRWLADRRHIYAAYLALVASLFKDIEDISVFLTSPGDEVDAERAASNEESIAEGVPKFYERWENEVQQAFNEVLLLARVRSG